MRQYKFRQLYTPQMKALKVILYQYDRLIQESCPLVYTHLERQGVVNTMYASQWFMTVFAYRLPLDIVYRILDVIFSEGLDAMLKFGVALIKTSAEVILDLEFEKLIECLTVSLFDPYINNPELFFS